MRSLNNVLQRFQELAKKQLGFEITLECNKDFLLKPEEQRQLHTLNCATITLSVVSSAVLHTLMYIWHFDSLTLCVCVWTSSECMREGDIRVHAYA